MADTIFVSWSKQPSGDLALLVKKWLANLLPTCKPFFSREIVKGREGDIEIKKGLGGASFGVLCVTRNNVGEKWLLFEAGALYNRFETSEDTRVAPVLFDVEVGEVGAPLSKLQCTTFSENEMRDLAFSINAVLVQPFDPDFVREQFDRLWPDLRDAVSQTLLKAQSEGAVEKIEQPTIKELHEAVLRQGEMMQEVYRWVTQARTPGTGFMSPPYDAGLEDWQLKPNTLLAMTTTHRLEEPGSPYLRGLEALQQAMRRLDEMISMAEPSPGESADPINLEMVRDKIKATAKQFIILEKLGSEIPTSSPVLQDTALLRKRLLHLKEQFFKLAKP